MAMNHRCSARISLHVEVDVFHQGRTLGRYLTRDINPEGVFIETGPVALYPNDIVELEFVVSGDISRIDRMKAMVIWHNGGGIGLLFTESDPAFYDRLGQQFPELVDSEMLRITPGRRPVVK